jgi:hypothetical protein
MKKKSLNKSKSKDKKDKKDKSKSKSSDKKSKSSKSKKSSRSNSKEKVSSKGTEKNIEESINPEVSGINKEPGQNNNLDLTYTQYFSNRNLQLQNNNINNVFVPNGVPKCDGCFENDAVCFCKECKKYLCGLCDNQIHIIPVNSNHLRVNLNEIVKMKKLCYHHQSKLEYFCESCDEAICKQCQIIGPHNTNYHRIIPIREAFNKKFYQLSKMKPILMNKLGELNYYNNRVNDLTEKVNKEKKILIRDIRSQYSVLSEKIKDVEGKRNAILSFETSQLQIDNNNIQDINYYVSDVQSKKGPTMISFLLQYPQLRKKIERILEKPLKEKIDLSDVENYPNDLEERHKILEDYDKIQKQLETRNDTIWKLLNEKKQKEKSILDNAKKKSMEQIEEKAKLSDKYDKDLKKFMKVCSFCGKYIDKKTINSECQANEKFYLNFYFSKEAPPMNMINTKRHYFAEPVSNNLSELLQIAEKMWDKQRNEMTMKMREEEERMQQQQYIQNMQAQSMNMNNINNMLTSNNMQNIKVNEQRQNYVSPNGIYNSNTNNTNTNNNNPASIYNINMNNMNTNNNIDYNLNMKSIETLVNETNVNNQKETINVEEVKQRKNNNLRGADNLVSSDAPSFETEQQVTGKEIAQNLLKIIEEKNIDLFTLLSGYDLDEDGILEQNELKFAINKINQLNQNDFETLLQFFNLSEKINIKDFLNKFNHESLDKLNHSSFSKKSQK